MTHNPASNPIVPEDDPGDALSGAEIARAAGIIMFALILAGVLGLVRQVVIAAAFGAGRDLDAFYAALRVPETLFVLVAGGALGSAFIPVFQRFLARDDFAGAWRLASAVFSLMSLAALALCVVIFALAEPIVAATLTPGADATAQALTVELMRIMLVTVLIFGVSGLVMGILNGYQHFTAPALAPSVYNIGLIFGAVALAPTMGVHGLAWGAVLGAGLHLFIQVPNLLRLEYFALRFWPAPRAEGVGEVLLLMGPRVLGLGVVQVNFWVNTALTSDMQPGSLTAITTAFTLMFTVLGILGQSIGTAVFPTLSRLYAENDEAGFGRYLLSSLSSVLFMSIPAGFGLAALSMPIIIVFFERGEWTRLDSAGTAWALALFSIGLAGHAVLEILARAFYARHDTWTPVVVGIFTMALNITLSLILIRVFGYPETVDFARGPFGGLALAMSIATAIESTILWVLLRRRMTLQDGPVLRSATGVLFAALLMSGGLALWLRLTVEGTPLLQLIGGVTLGAAIFGVATLALGIPEARAVPRMVWGRLKVLVGRV